MQTYQQKKALLSATDTLALARQTYAAVRKRVQREHEGHEQLRDMRVVVQFYAQRVAELSARHPN